MNSAYTFTFKQRYKGFTTFASSESVDVVAPSLEKAVQKVTKHIKRKAKREGAVEYRFDSVTRSPYEVIL